MDKAMIVRIEEIFLLVLAPGIVFVPAGFVSHLWKEFPAFLTFLFVGEGLLFIAFPDPRLFSCQRLTEELVISESYLLSYRRKVAVVETGGVPGFVVDTVRMGGARKNPIEVSLGELRHHVAGYTNDNRRIDEIVVV